MGTRAKALLRRGIDAVLVRRGYSGTDLELARGSVLDWIRARAKVVLRRRGVVAGVGVVVSRPGRAELLPLEVQLPAPGEITVELLVTAVSSGTERAQWLRLPNARPSLPFTPGYSGAGRVLAVGSGVTGLAVGGLVAVPRAGHASVQTVPAAWAVPIPDGVRVEDAALVYLAIISGYGVRRAAIAPGDPVAVIGAGPIGALAQRLAALQDPGPITVVATSDRRRAETLAAGAARFVTVDEGVEPDAAVVIEATGDPDAFATAIAGARPGGTVVLLGSSRGVTRNVPVDELRRKELRVVGAHVSALATEAKRAGGDPFRELATTFLDALAQGRLDVSDLVGEAVDPREAGHFYRRLGAGEVATAHLDWRLLRGDERSRRRGLVSGPLLAPRSGRVPVAATASPKVDGGRPLRFAAIGCGDIGAENARSVARAANAELVLLHDAVPALAEQAAARYGGEVVADLDGALDADRVDAVVISVPHDLHAPLAVRALEAGLHVVVEKPLAVDLAAAQEIADAAAGTDRTVSVAFVFRYEPDMVAARALVEAGALGGFRAATLALHLDKPPSYWLGGFSGRATSDWRSRRERAGGGTLIMNLTHYVDFVRHLTGVEAERVAATAWAEDGREVEDAIALAVEYEGGAVGSLFGSASTRGVPAPRFELVGSTGTLVLAPQPRVYSERAVAGLAPARWHGLPTEPAVDSRTVFFERFAAAVRDGRPPDVTLADGLAVQAFVEAAYRSLQEGRPVDVAPLAGVA